MKNLNAMRLVVFLGLALPAIASGADRHRTNINPALLYWQAFAEVPDLAADEKQLVEDWRKAPLTPEARAVIDRFTNAFRLMQRGASSSQPCDTGVDLADGPEALLPHLAKTKILTQRTCLAVRFDLEQGKQSAAVDRLAAALAMSRHLSSDAVLISILIQIANEDVVLTCIADNFHLFGDVGLRDLWTKLNLLPQRVSVAQSIPTEKAAFLDWLDHKLRDFRTEHPGKEQEALTYFRNLMRSIDPEAQNLDLVDDIIEASGGSIADVLEYIKKTGTRYEEAKALMALPYAQFRQQAPAFDNATRTSENPLVSTLFPALAKAAYKEFRVQAHLEMLRAAIEFRLRGEAGLKSVADPFGSGPFAFQQVENGFELRSALDNGASGTLKLPVALTFAAKSPGRN